MYGLTMCPVKAINPRVCYADLERAPEDGRRYELYDGEVFVVPAPLPKRQVVALTIAEMLRRIARENGGFAAGNMPVTSAVLPAHSFRAETLFPDR